MTAIYLPDFRLYLPLYHSTLSMRGIPSSYRVHIGYEKTKMAGLQFGEGRMMIDSVVWTQYINVQTHRQTDRQPRRHSNCRSNALYREAKIGEIHKKCRHHCRSSVNVTVCTLLDVCRYKIALLQSFFQI